MEEANELKKKRHIMGSSRSIRKLLQQKWLVVVIALILTGLGAALTGVLFQAGVYSVEAWRIKLLENWPPWLVLPILGGLGGLIAGIAAFPRKEGQLIAWGWLLLVSPLWIMLFGIFGIAPVITRTSEILPLLRNSVGFLSTTIVGYLIAKSVFKK